MTGRRTSLASLAGAKVDVVPGRSDPLLLTITLDKLVPTRFNPRRNFGTDEDLAAFGLILKKRQLQPAVVVSRAAYLRLWPDEAEHVGSRTYVIANGERRYRASLAAGLPTLNVVHNEDVANSRADFLDAVLSENNDREDLDPIERALGIETMVAELGGADQVAAHYEKSKGWVSQQRKLLKLTEHLQALVSSGDMPVRVARDIAGLPADEQGAAWAAEEVRRQEVKAQPRARAPQKSAVPPGPRVTAAQPGVTPPVVPKPSAVLAEPAPAPVPSAEPDRFTAVNQTGPNDALALGPPSALPEPRGTQSPPAPAAVPDGRVAMDELFDVLDVEQRQRAIRRYLARLGSPAEVAADLMAAAPPAFLEGLVAHLQEKMPTAS